MHADDADVEAVDLEIGEHRAARLERGQVDQLALQTISTDFFTSIALPCQPMLPARVSNGTGL